MQRRGSNQVHGRSSIADYLCPDNGYRGMMKRQGKELKDHMKENRMELKDQQQRQRDKRLEQAQPERELYKLEQFKNVASRAFEPTNTNTSRNDSGDITFLQKGKANERRNELAKAHREIRSEVDNQLKEAIKKQSYVKSNNYVTNDNSNNTMVKVDSIGRPITPRKEQVPREMGRLNPRNNSDFIERNRIKANTMLPPTHPVNTMKSAKHEDFGRVPAYLEDRKQQWQEEKDEMKRRQPDPNCPRGMKLMPEEERVQTLEVLLCSKDEVMKLLNKMPFVLETPSLRRKQGEYEHKLREIENAIELFSKTKVFIADN